MLSFREYLKKMDKEQTLIPRADLILAIGTSGASQFRAAVDLKLHTMTVLIPVRQ